MNFNALIGIWVIHVDYEAKRKSKNHERGEIYKIDTTVTSDIFFKLMTENAIPEIVKK